MKANRIKRILGNFSVVNIAMAAVLVALAGYSVPPLLNKSMKLKLPSPKVVKTAPSAETTNAPDENKSPSPADYFLVADRNIFHPERKIPVEEKAADQPLPTPDFVLYGTVLVDDLHVAYMEDKKAPQNTPTRGKKQIPLKPGESLSGFTLKEIEPDQVVMVRGEERIVVNLNDSSKVRASAGPPPSAAAAAPAGAKATQAQTPVPGDQTAGTSNAPRIRRRAVERFRAAQQNPSPDQAKAANQLLNIFRSRNTAPGQ